MADEKKTKKEKPAVEKADSKPVPEARPATETKPVTEAKPAAETKTDVPAEAKSEAKSYSRGEGQKAVTQAYKDNWNTIFGKKKR